MEPEAEVVETAEPTEQSEPAAEDQSAAVEASNTEHVEEAASDEETSDDGEGLLVKPEELEEIRKNPALNKLYKSLNKGYTQKSQALSQQRKQDEYVSQLAASLRSDPRGTVELLAKQVGLNLNQEASKSERKDEVSEELTRMFGAEVGAQLAGIVNKAVDSRVQERTKGLETTSQQALAETHRVASEAVLNSFTEAHPEIRDVIGHAGDGTAITLEDKMLEFGKKFIPAQPMDENEYLDHLLKVAKASLPQAKQTKQVIDRLNNAAQASESPANGAPAAKVAQKFPRGKNAFKDAFRMAKEGMRATE